MTSSVAPPAPFNEKKETWKNYMSRFRNFLIAANFKDLDDERKRALFLNYCGLETYTVAQNLVDPTDVVDADWKTLQDKLAAHFQPTATKMVSRNEFHHRRQREGESINDFVTALRDILARCRWTDPEEQLKDRIVLGMRDKSLQKKLLVQDDATLQDVLRQAKSAESANESAAELTRVAHSVHRTRVHHDWTEVPDTDEEDEESDREECHQVRDRRDSAGRDEPRKLKCPGCNGNHPRSKCPFSEATCKRCGRKGHIAEACRAILQGDGPTDSFPRRQNYNSWTNRGNQGRPGQRRPANRGSASYASRPRQGKVGEVIHMTSAAEEKISIKLKLNGVDCSMELDTGSTYTIIAWNTIKRIMPNIGRECLKKTVIKLKDFQGNSIPLLGILSVPVQFKKFKGELEALIVDGPWQTLLGMRWLMPLGITISGINQITESRKEAILNKYKDVFSTELGTYQGKPITFSLDPLINPIRLKPRRVPLPILPKVDQQLDKLIAQGVLIPIEHAEWETPIVTPMKPDGSVRICADYRATLNRALRPHAYPVPVVQHLLHSLGHGKIFAKLDLAQAYQQLPVDDKTAEAQTIVTHRGAFKCSRLQFGVSVAPGIFQSLMERLLQGIPGVMPYFDDVLISGETQEQLWDRLEEVLKRFQDKGLRLKQDKCTIGVPSVNFLGFRIDEAGIHPTDEKIEAIKKAPTPRNKTELQAFLGLLNFYAVFLKQKATIAEPLHKLLTKGAIWRWEQQEDNAFREIKNLLSSKSVLIQYNNTLPLRITCDASPFGVGAVLSHVFPNGTEGPIAYYSRTMSSAERNYGQIDKEALAIVAAVKRFHYYVYGRKFQIVTDHKPLLGILAGDKPTPQFISARMSRWSLFLAGYDYELQHHSGKNISHADALSRCPQQLPVLDPAPANTVFLIELDGSNIITAEDIARETAKDTQLCQVRQWVLRGWPQETLEEQFKIFKSKQHELTTMRDCVLWGERVVIPKTLRKGVMQTLHEGHPGMVRMKSLARGHMWWPNLDKDIEDWVATCDQCQENRPLPPKTTPMAWEQPSGPWSRIHIDFAGPINNQMFLIVVDAFSKWLEIIPMPSTTTCSTIKALTHLFATHGLPDVLVSDNGPQLTARQMETFLAQLGIRHALVAPYSPASNGLAERAVRVAKEAIAKAGPGDWQNKLDKFLLTQHITPCAATHKSPAEMLMGRKLRSTLDRLHPTYQTNNHKASQEPERTLRVGEKVFAKSQEGRKSWEKATIIERTGPKSYIVSLEDGREWRRHIDQIRRRQELAPLRAGHSEDPSQTSNRDGQPPITHRNPRNTTPEQPETTRDDSTRELTGTTVDSRSTPASTATTYGGSTLDPTDTTHDAEITTEPTATTHDEWHPNKPRGNPIDLPALQEPSSVAPSRSEPRSGTQEAGNGAAATTSHRPRHGRPGPAESTASPRSQHGRPGPAEATTSQRPQPGRPGPPDGAATKPTYLGEVPATTVLRRSGRERRPPQRLADYVR